jgi:colanic acid biosynthesis glycosyl transferase WcaI
MRIVVLCPHFDPDTAPTGHVMSRIVEGLAARGHEAHVVTALPWYRDHAIEPGWGGRLARRQRTAWGSITRVNPFPGGDRRNLPRRTLGYVGFSFLVGTAGLRAGGWFRRADAVIAMSPPLTLGLTGWAAKLAHRSPLVFNIQDVFPDAAIETGAITDRRVIAVARWLERVSYHRADAVTVVSADLADNVRAKVGPRHRSKVRVIPNFVDTTAIHPSDRATAYRRQLAIGDEPVVMYAGNVGFSQSLDMIVAAARATPEATFVINGHGAARPRLEAAADGVANIRFGDHQPADRLNEVLATGDIHLVPLRRGLGRVSVPSKIYSILAAGRPVVAAIDADSEVSRIVTTSGCGVVVAPDDTQAFIAAIRTVLDTIDLGAGMGRAGRAWVERAASPGATAAVYEELFGELARGRFGRPRQGNGLPRR